MSFLYAFIFGALFCVSLGEVTVTPQPPYQGAYLYQEVGASLQGITSCDNVADSSNVTMLEMREVESTTCYYHGANVTLKFMKKDVAEPATNSTNARYYLLPSNTTLIVVEDPPGWYSSNVEVHCWNGTGWETGDGWITADKKKICCNNKKSDVSCSDIIFLDEECVLEEQQEKLDVGYGFQVSYTTTIWPSDKLRTELTCGNYTCLFEGTLTESGSCTDLDYDSIASEKSNYVPFKENFEPLQSPRHQQLHDLNISVPYLTKDFEGAKECEVRLLLGEVEQELVRSVLQLNLNDTPTTVSADSDIGLLNLAHFQDTDKDPKCIGDGWPLPDSRWWFKNPQGKLIELPKFGSRKKVAGKKFQCNASRDSDNSTEIKHMMFVKVPESNSLCTYNSKIIDVGREFNLTCKTNIGAWEPKPSRLGWTTPNGTESLSSFTAEEDGNLKRWSVRLIEEGIYKCWAEIDETWSEPDQEATFRLSKDIRVENRQSSSSESQTIKDITLTPADTDSDITAAPATINSTKGSPSETRTTSTHHWYLIGLGVLALFLAVSTTFIYKIVKKNQAKVSNLDTKLSLDKVKTKMGVNALYSKVNLEEEEPLLARIPRIGKEDLVTDRVLGSGQFGKVLKGRLTVTDEDGIPGEIDVAVKCLMHPDDESSTEDFLKEVVMMYQLDHPNVIKLLGVCTEYDQYMIVSEFMAHGNLRDFLMNREPVLSLIDKLYICYQVVCGLEHMVAQNIVHRDIAARNCLVGPNLLVKVADFGLSRSLTMSNYYKKVGGQVPIRWMSPESLKYGKYTPESDVWAFGVLMWEVYTEGHFPYSGYSNEEVQGMLDNGFKLHVPPHCTEDVSVLMQATWETDPANRPTFRTIRTRLNQMLRNSGMSNILHSSADPDSLPSTSTQGSQDAALRDSTMMTDSNVRSPCYPGDTLSHAPCFAGEGSSRTTCCLGEESSSGTITNNEVATNRYASEPGVVTVETAL